MTRIGLWIATAVLAATVLAPGASAFEAITGQEPGGGAPAASPLPGSGFAGDPDTRLAQAAKHYAKAVGLVVVAVPGGPPEPIGTAWAIRPDTFATNAHIAEPVAELLNKGQSVWIALNRTSNVQYRVVRAIAHGRYGEKETSYQGQQSLGSTYDVGLLMVDGRTDTVLPVAPASELKRLDAGYRVAYLGFPMESLINDNVNPYNPIATMQSGILTAVSDYFQADGGFERNVLLRHNMGAAGGASGSPIFNVRGEVVGILNAGNMTFNLVLTATGEPTVERAPSAAMVNFAQRVDLLNDLLR